MSTGDPNPRRRWAPAAAVVLLATAFLGAQVTGFSTGVPSASGCGGGAADPSTTEAVAVQAVVTTQPGLHTTDLEQGGPNQWCSDRDGQGPTGVTTWNRPGTEARCVWDDDEDHTTGDGRSIRLEPETARSKVQGLATVRYQISGLIPQQTYEFSAWVRSRSRTPAMLFMAGVTNPNNGPLAASTVPIAPSTDKWTRLAIEGVTQGDTLTVGLLAEWTGRGGGRIWIDDLAVTIRRTGLACDGVTDDTATLQALLDDASPGDTIHLPHTGTNFCRTTASLKVNKGVTIAGQGPAGRTEIRRTDISPTRATHIEGAVIAVLASGAHIRGLHLTGSEYGDVRLRNTHGIWAIGSPNTPLHNITVEDCVLEGFRGRGISLDNFNDFIIANNTVSRAGYAGIMVTSVQRGRISDNSVTNINAPEVCALKKPARDCQYLNSYPIAISGCGDAPCSEDVIIERNVVRENELWVGIMNHGGHRVLVVDNDVADTNFLYANTVSEGANLDASDHTWFINNVGDIRPTSVGGRYDLPPQSAAAPPKGDGLWLAGPVGRATVGLRAVGNVFHNTGNADAHSGLWADGMTQAVISHNIFESASKVLPPVYGIRLMAGHAHQDSVIAHNQISAKLYGVRTTGDATSDLIIANNVLGSGNWGVWFETPGTVDLRDNDFTAATQGASAGAYTPTTVTEATPSAPSWTAAGPGPSTGSVTLAWAYLITSTEAHDSFYIEYTPSGTAQWARLAYRPGNDPMWRFVAPSNVRWVAYDPLSYTARGLTSGQSYDFRIRANNGSLVSGWSATISAVAP